MNRLTYYSPFLIGLGLSFLMHQVIEAALPAEWLNAKWLWVAVSGLTVGLHLQILMIGAQGAFSQVLPVPRGRSIRGRGAVVGGVLIIGWIGLGLVTALLYSEDVRVAVWIAAGLSLACGAGALVAYAWCWPTAAPDFSAKD